MLFPDADGLFPLNIFEMQSEGNKDKFSLQVEKQGRQLNPFATSGGKMTSQYFQNPRGAV